VAIVHQEATLSDKFSWVWPHLNERQRRLVAAAEARALGRGGLKLVASAAGMSRTTVARAIGELDEPPLGEPGRQRSRRPGGGRKRAAVLDPALPSAVDALVEPGARGDPESPLRWTVKSTR
jgi:hypothetical protein